MAKTDPDFFPIGLQAYELSRDMRRYMQMRARAAGYTHEQWRALWHLDRNEGITQAGLADILDIQPISLARTLDRMVAAGLIERRPDPNDRRAQKLFLTPQAEPILEMLRAEFEVLRARVTEGMTEKQQSEMVALLGQMRANLNNFDFTQNGAAKKAAQG